MRRRTWICAAALVCALTAAPSAFAYEITFTETLTTGAAGASPDLILRVAVPLGSGAVVPGSESTARIVLRIDGGHFGTAGARGLVEALAAANAGTAIGVAKFEFDYGDYASDLRINSVRRSFVDASTVLSGTIEPTFMPAVPVQIAAGPFGELAVSMDIRPLSAELRGRSPGYSIGQLEKFELRLAGTLAGGHITANPASPATYRTSVEAVPCGDDACAWEAPAARASASITLPKQVILNAPASFVYGQLTRFTGTGRTGDVARLYVRDQRRYALPDRLIPVPGATAIVGRDGRFAMRVRLRSFVDRSGNWAGRLLAAATGRYVVIVTEAGAGAIETEASGVSHGRLAAPVLRWVRCCSPHRTLVVYLPGGRAAAGPSKDLVSAPIKLTLRRGTDAPAKGEFDSSGRFATTLLDGAKGTYHVVAYVKGAGRSTSNSVDVGRVPRSKTQRAHAPTRRGSR